MSDDSPTDLFYRQVYEAMNKVDGTTEETQRAIEDAYERHIRESGVSKAALMSNLFQRNEAMFAAVMNHLFTPVNWSKVKMRTLWGIKNHGTGNLVSLGKGENDGFELKDCGKDILYAPMLTGNEDHARSFLALLQQPLEGQDRPLSVGEVIISLEIEQGVNPANLEVVRVSVIS